MDTGRISLRDCSHETYKLRASLQAIDHIGSGGNAAVVRGFVDGGAPQDLALKLLDPRRVTADDREREYRRNLYNLKPVRPMYAEIKFHDFSIPRVPLLRRASCRLSQLIALPETPGFRKLYRGTGSSPT